MRWAADILCANDLTATQRLVLVCLSNHHHNTTGACFPSMESIAIFCGVSDRRARMAVSDLEALGLIARRKRVTSQGQSSNQYDLFGTVKRADKKSRARADARVRGGGRTLGSANREVSITDTLDKGLRVVGGRDA